MTIPNHEDKEVYEEIEKINQEGLSWYIWAIMLVGVVAIVSLPNYTKEDEKPREHRVYQSKDLYDRVVKENP